MQPIQVIDSHTGGEPTRVVLEGVELQGSTMSERRDDFRDRLDHLRRGIVREPRGSEVLVGAVLTPPVSSDAIAGIVFFNDAGYLGMCGHGTIGIVETLRHLGRVTSGLHRFDTPVGPVTATLHEGGEVEIRNVTSYRHLADVSLDVEGLGTVVGDVAYGGNWFFIVESPHFPISMANTTQLTAICWSIRAALSKAGITGVGAAEVDHIELAGLEAAVGADARNFVQCPGGAYDRSPCGTGTSAKMACLHARGRLAPGEWYVQESVTGSRFRGRVELVDGGVTPTIVGRAYVTGEATLLFRDDDPIRWGLDY